MFKLLENRDKMFEDEMTEIIYSLPPNQHIDFPNHIKHDLKVSIFEGIPDFQQYNDRKPRLIIIDDQIQECGKDVVALFTRGSHHYNLSVILLTQNIFFANPGFRTMSLNAHYIVLFKSPRSMDQVSCIARQISPSNVRFFQETFSDSCKFAHGYLLLDMTQACDDDLRYRTNIFPDDKNCTTVYLPTSTANRQ